MLGFDTQKAIFTACGLISAASILFILDTQFELLHKLPEFVTRPANMPESTDTCDACGKPQSELSQPLKSVLSARLESTALEVRAAPSTSTPH